MSDYQTRLERFLAERDESLSLQQLTPDASTREYFRIGWKEVTAIACVYPEPFIESEQSYLDVTRLFLSAGLPVAEVLDFDEKLGVIVLEDLGDRILRDVIANVKTASDSDRVPSAEQLINESIALIAKIQSATATAFATNSIASRLKFDKEKLLWELDFSKTHYFTTFKKQPLPPETDAALGKEFAELAAELDSKATVLCHRDFHAANLMLDKSDRLRIIDHQDARIGSVAYDLVSLLLDRVTEPPTAEWLAEKRRLFLADREALGLEKIDEQQFADEFRLQTIQRCLKAVGTFSFQSVNRGKTYFVPFIKPMFEIVLRGIGNLEKFPNLKMALEYEVSPDHAR